MGRRVYQTTRYDWNRKGGVEKSERGQGSVRLEGDDYRGRGEAKAVEQTVSEDGGCDPVSPDVCCGLASCDVVRFLTQRKHDAKPQETSVARLSVTGVLKAGRGVVTNTRRVTDTRGIMAISQGLYCSKPDTRGRWLRRKTVTGVLVR